MTVFIKNPSSGIYYMDFVIQGKRIQKSCGTKLLKEALKAEEKAREELSIIDSGGSGEEVYDNLRLRLAIEKAYKEHWKGQASGEQTLARLFKCLDILGDVPISSINGKDFNTVRQSLKGEGLSPSTINRYLIHLKTLLNIAELDWGMPIKRFRVKLSPKPEGRQRIITKEEEELILNFLRSTKGRGKELSCSLADLVEVLIGTGMRLGEALTMTYQHNIDIDEKLIVLQSTMTKTKSSRIVPLTDRVTEILKARKVAFRTKPFPYRKDTIVWLWAKMRVKLGFKHDKDFVIHSLRHTFATRLLDAGRQIYEAQRLLGHKSISTTEIYAKLQLTTLRKAVQALESPPAASIGPLGGQ